MQERERALCSATTHSSAALHHEDFSPSHSHLEKKKKTHECGFKKGSCNVLSFHLHPSLSFKLGHFAHFVPFQAKRPSA